MFDLRVEIKDPTTGQITKYQPYKMRVSAAEGTLFERPPESGWWFHGNGEVAKEPSEEQKKSFAAKNRVGPSYKIGNKTFDSQEELDQYVTELEAKIAAAQSAKDEPAPADSPTATFSDPLPQAAEPVAQRAQAAKPQPKPKAS